MRHLSSRTMLLALSLIAAAVPTPLLAQVAFQPNAQVVNANVNCRSALPRYGAGTLFTGTLEAGQLVTVIAANSRVQALGRGAVGSAEWYHVRTAGSRPCWMYSGPIGRPQYLRLDPNVHVGWSNSEPVALGVLPAVANLLPSAYAQQRLDATASDEGLGVDTTRNVLVVAVNFALFLSTLVVCGKFVFPRSPKLTLASGVCVLVIEGVLSQTLLSGLLTQLTKL
jgi:hypothetical protein